VLTTTVLIPRAFTIAKTTPHACVDYPDYLPVANTTTAEKLNSIAQISCIIIFSFKNKYDKAEEMNGAVLFKIMKIPKGRFFNA